MFFVINISHISFDKIEEYKLIESHINYEFTVSKKEEIRLVSEFFSSGKFFRVFKPVDTLSSPDVLIIFEKKDGSKDKLEIYGGAWNSSSYLFFNGEQYRVLNTDKFYEDLDELIKKIMQ